MEEFKILTGIKKDKEVTVIEISIIEPYNDGEPRKLSISFDNYDKNSFSEEEGERQAEEYLDDGETWKEAVASGRTVDSMEDFNEQFIRDIGWEEVIGDVYEIQNGRYVYWYSNCSVTIDEFKELFIPNKDVEFILEMKQKYYYKPLSEIPEDLLKKLFELKKYESDIGDYENSGEDDEDWEEDE